MNILDTTLLACAACLIGARLGAAEAVVQLADLPLPVRTAITGNAAGAAIERITSDDAQGTVVYTARIRTAGDGALHALRIAQDGRVLAEGPSTSEPTVGAPSKGVPLSGARPADGAKP